MAALGARAAAEAEAVVGFLSSRSPGESSELVAAFLKALRQMVFIEGQNAMIAFRWAEGHYGRLPALASNLVDMRPAVLLTAGGAVSAQAAACIRKKRVHGPPIDAGVKPIHARRGGQVGLHGLDRYAIAAKSICRLLDLRFVRRNYQIEAMLCDP